MIDDYFGDATQGFEFFVIKATEKVGREKAGAETKTNNIKVAVTSKMLFCFSRSYVNVGSWCKTERERQISVPERSITVSFSSTMA